MSRLRTGILGCGGIANAHARTILAAERLQLVAFCDILGERAESFNAQYAEGKGKTYTDYRQMYDEAKLDVVYICLPPFAHTRDVEDAAAAGIHILIEKPICLDMKQARSMARASEKHGIKTQVGFMSRHGDAVRMVKGMLESGEAGRAGLMIASYKCNSLHSPWWRDKSKSGGQVVEQIVHTFDITRFLLGKPKSVFCHMDNLFHRRIRDYTVEDVSATSIQFANGAVASVAGTNGAIPGKWLNEYELIAQNVTVRFQDMNNATIHHTDAPGDRQTIVQSGKDTFLAETLDLIEAIDSDGETVCPMSEGAETLRLVLAVAQSGETGEVVKLR